MSGQPAQQPNNDASETTYQFIIRMFGASVSLVLVMIVGVLCYRVAVDGESAITLQITQQLASIVPWLAGAMVASVVGVKALATWITTKLP